MADIVIKTVICVGSGGCPCSCGPPVEPPVCVDGCNMACVTTAAYTITEHLSGGEGGNMVVESFMPTPICNGDEFTCTFVLTNELCGPCPGTLIASDIFIPLADVTDTAVFEFISSSLTFDYSDTIPAGGTLTFTITWAYHADQLTGVNVDENCCIVGLGVGWRGTFNPDGEMDGGGIYCGTISEECPVSEPLTINEPTYPSMQEGLAITPFSAVGSGGTPPYTYSVFSGSLPAGITLNSSSGVISGTPTTPGTGSTVFRVTDDIPDTANSSSRPWSVAPGP